MAAKKGSTGRRYSEAERKKIIAFVESQGRGGMARAKEKFGVSYIALNRWLKGIGFNPGKGKVKKATPGKVKGLKGVLTLVNKLKAKLESMS